METIVIKPEKVEIDPILKNNLKNLCKEESQVVVHCSISIPYLQFMRIWKSTFLVPHNSTNKFELTHSENITFHPQWMVCLKGTYEFTLFFKGLPKDCFFFDLFEDIPEPGGGVEKKYRAKQQ